MGQTRNEPDGWRVIDDERRKVLRSLRRIEEVCNVSRWNIRCDMARQGIHMHADRISQVLQWLKRNGYAVCGDDGGWSSVWLEADNK